MENNIYESLIILSKRLRDQISNKGNVSVYDDQGKPHCYIFATIENWLLKECPANFEYQEQDQSNIVKEIFNYILSDNLIPVDLVNDRTCNQGYYYSDLDLINTNEKIFGEKNSGIVIRDNGTYGSLPLFDDYSEESES